MPQKKISLEDGVDLIIEEPYDFSYSNQATLVASVIINEFGGNKNNGLSLLNRKGEFDFEIGGTIFKIYYQYKAKKVINSLEAYSAAIKYIEKNINQYDFGLAQKAIEVLKQCYWEDLHR